MPLPNVVSGDTPGCTGHIKPRLKGYINEERLDNFPLAGVTPVSLREEIIEKGQGTWEVDFTMRKVHYKGTLLVEEVYTRQCDNPAVTGEEVCKFHGAGGGHPLETGAYSKYSESLDKKMESALSHTELKKLDQEISLMRGVLQEVLEAINNAEDKNIYDSKELLKLQTTADSIRKLVETHAKIEEQERITMSLTKLDLLGAQCLMIVKEALTSFLNIVEEKTDMSFTDEFTKVLIDTGVKLKRVKIVDGET